MSTDKPNKKETVIETFPFLAGDARWAGAFEIVEREQTFDDGHTRTFSDMRLRIGSRTVALPRRGFTELLAAGQRAVARSAAHYNELIQRLNAGQGKDRSRPGDDRREERR